MKTLCFIGAILGLGLAFNEGEGFPFINFMGVLLILASVIIHELYKEKKRNEKNSHDLCE